MEDLSLHILDIAENAIRASARRIEIVIVEAKDEDMLSLEIKDDGQGMDEETLRRALDPFFTTKSDRRTGLGLSLLAQSAKQSGGGLELESSPGAGTTVKATFQYSHFDRKPIGDMVQTMITLISGNPGVDFVYEHREGDSVYRLDSSELRRESEQEANG